MIRATITAILMSLVVVLLGGSALLIGLIYPSRHLVAFVSWIWAWTILRTAGVQLTIEGARHLAAGPGFFVANHQSALDIPILIYALRGNVRFLAKNTLFHIPVFGWALARYGFVPVYRNDARRTLRTVNRMLTRLKKSPVSFAVFPESTRSRDGRTLPFRRGAMKICQRSGLTIVPVAIDGSICVHHRDRFHATPGPVRLIFCEPISASDAQAMSSSELTERVTQMIAPQLKRMYSGRPAKIQIAGAEVAG